MEQKKSFVELTRYLFTVSGVKVFLSQRICQNVLENSWAATDRGRACNDNPNALEFYRNTQPLRVINTASRVVEDNCCGTMKEHAEIYKENQPLKGEGKETVCVMT